MVEKIYHSKTEKLKAAHKKARRTEPKLASFGHGENNKPPNKPRLIGPLEGVTIDRSKQKKLKTPIDWDELQWAILFVSVLFVAGILLGLVYQNWLS